MARLLLVKWLSNISQFFTYSSRPGYIVLLPEISEDLPEDACLIKHNCLPNFDNITVDHFMKSVAKQTLDLENGVSAVENFISKKSPESVDIFKEVLNPLEELNCALESTWGLAKTLYLSDDKLMPPKNYLAIHDRSKQARLKKFYSRPIYNVVKKNLEVNNKSHEKTRVLNKFLIEGKLNGLDLNPLQASKLLSYTRKLAVEKSTFRSKIELSTRAFRHEITEPLIYDFPKELCKLMSSNPSNNLNGPWFVTLQQNLYLPFMEHCSDRTIRWNVWQAMVARGSKFQNKQYFTSVHLEEIRFLRRMQANILGYQSFADMTMETKMAGSVNNVNKILDTLLTYAKPAQDEQLKQLYAFATGYGFDGPSLQLWDVPFWSRQQRIHQLKLQEDNLRDYFPLLNVLEGLFRFSEKMFGIIIKPRSNVSTWNSHVKFFDIFESDGCTLISSFYLDPYCQNKSKINGLYNGWTIGIQPSSKVTGTLPLAALIFNFKPPTSDTPTLLSFKEVSLLFSKFGHSLQQLLCQTSYSEVSGFTNVEWDAVEVSGNVFANWLYNKYVLDLISCHYKTGEKLPEDVIKSLCLAKTQMSGVDLCRELYLSKLDIELYSCNKIFWHDIVKELWSQYRSFPLDDFDYHPCSFSSIFVDEWAATYYSHLWARIIAADVSSAFSEVKNEEELLQIGRRFRETYLTLGGSLHPTEVFRKFRGRDPSPKSLINALGFTNKDDISS